MNKIEFFINDRYLVLKTLYEHQIEINNTEICPITQQEIADVLGCSKAKVNMVLNELINNGYVQIYNNTKGRYVLTEEAKKIMKKLKS
ncbi:MAG: helix-turn-helix domain-containing protein [Acetatifactor sp.]|nr:helix-turn-helix domain-containing protein [Acetatifactor sp.]